MTKTTITAIKGFDKNLACRGFQFAVGQTYTHGGIVKACEGGFHAVPDDLHPLTVFEFYPPATSRFCVVEVSGKVDRETDKVAAEILTIKREIGVGDLADGAVNWVMARATPEGEVAVKDNGLVCASGDQGAATASGTQGAATASGTQGAATASGTRGAATASGTRGAATAMHKTAGAYVTGYDGTVSGVAGAAIHADERADDGTIVSVACGIVGKSGIEPNVKYRCKDGALVKAE
jgi:hypothetical protein